LTSPAAGPRRGERECCFLQRQEQNWRRLVDLLPHVYLSRWMNSTTRFEFSFVYESLLENLFFCEEPIRCEFW